MLDSSGSVGDPISLASFTAAGGELVFEHGADEQASFDEQISFLTTFERNKKRPQTNKKWKIYEEAIAELVMLKRDLIEKTKLCEEIIAEYMLCVERLKEKSVC